MQLRASMHRYATFLRVQRLPLHHGLESAISEDTTSGTNSDYKSCRDEARTQCEHTPNRATVTVKNGESCVKAILHRI